MEKEISRQLQWQWDKKARGLCPSCGKKAARDYVHCRKCVLRIRKASRKKRGCKRRYRIPF